MQKIKATETMYSGLNLMLGVSPDDRTWVRVSDCGPAIGETRKAMHNFLISATFKKKLEEGALAKDGTMVVSSASEIQSQFEIDGYNKPVSFVPTEVVALFIQYKASRGNPQALALTLATLAADLRRTAKESNGFVVTAAQHEETRKEYRLSLIKELVQSVNGGWLGDDLIGEAGLTLREKAIAKELAYLREKQMRIKEPGMTPRDKEAIQRSIDCAIARLTHNGISLDELV
jgi:hypothetical protein